MSPVLGSEGSLVKFPLASQTATGPLPAFRFVTTTLPSAAVVSAMGALALVRLRTFRASASSMRTEPLVLLAAVKFVTAVSRSIPLAAATIRLAAVTSAEPSTVS